MNFFKNKVAALKNVAIKVGASIKSKGISLKDKSGNFLTRLKSKFFKKKSNKFKENSSQNDITFENEIIFQDEKVFILTNRNVTDIDAVKEESSITAEDNKEKEGIELPKNEEKDMNGTNGTNPENASKKEGE